MLLWVLQGASFPAGLQCRFGNASLVYVINATITDSQSAYCISPAWLAENNTRVNFSATTSGNACLTGVEFAYYLDPQVSQVAPLSGPRYGSFELRVQLEETVCSFADEVHVLLVSRSACTLLFCAHHHAHATACHYCMSLACNKDRLPALHLSRGCACPHICQ